MMPAALNDTLLEGACLESALLDQMNLRSCIVSRRAMERGKLIRFVLSPDGEVTPDLKENLPGRGVWVEARRSVLEKAMGKGHLVKGFKTADKTVRIQDDLPDRIGRLLDERAAEAFGLARKAGELVTGFTKADSAIRSGQAILLLHAVDAAADGRRKLASAIAFAGHMGGGEIEVVDCWPADRMGALAGRKSVHHAVALKGNAACNLMRAVKRLVDYRAETAPDGIE